MRIPITVVATTRPSATALPHDRRTATALIAPPDAIAEIDATEMLLAGGITASAPHTYFRSPGCSCCAIREDLVTAVSRAVRRKEPPEHVVVVVDPTSEDLLTVVGTLLSSFEISRRCSLDSVVVHLDAVELATRLATGDHVIDGGLEPAVAIADRLVVDQLDRVTEAARRSVSRALQARAGFARLVADASADDLDGQLDAWHGAPLANAVTPRRDDAPSTVVLRVETPLDPDAIDEWLDLLV
ncbi:MAG: GTP-binding protein, partial [Actinomycetota bacterium]